MQSKALVYLRELDFTDLSYYKSKKYGIKRAIYQYVGSTDETLVIRTSKWTYKNISKDNEIGKLLRALMQMNKFNNVRQLNRYLVANTRILKSYDTIEKARETESTMISINMHQAANHKWIICLNKRDAEVQISANGKYIIS